MRDGSEKGQGAEFEFPLRLWIDASLEVSNLSSKDRSGISAASLLAEPSTSDGRLWFAGCAPLLPVTEPDPTWPCFSTALATSLVAAVIERDSPGSSTAMLERAVQLCDAGLLEEEPYDVAELAAIISDDDDELIVVLDAVLRLQDGIPTDCPLHPMRFVLQVFTLNYFDEKVLLELLFDDDLGARAAFPALRRLFDWAREEREELGRVARAWRGRHIFGGGWREFDEEEEEEEEKDDEEEENYDEEEMEEAPSHSGSGYGGEDEEESEGPEPAAERETAEHESPFLIRIVQIMGEMEDERTFLLPSEEEPRLLERPRRRKEKRLPPGEEDGDCNAWMRLLHMSRRLSENLQLHVKVREANMRRESRRLVEIIELFLDDVDKDAEEEPVFKVPLLPPPRENKTL